MGKRSHKKEYTVATDIRVTSCSTLYETREKSKIKNILKKLIHIKKGH
jgi:hypothetical protein